MPCQRLTRNGGPARCSSSEVSFFLDDILSLHTTQDCCSLHRTTMAFAKSLAILISFLVIQKITAVSSDIPTPAVKPPVIVTMHVGQPVTITQQSQNVTSHVPVFTVCPLGAHLSHNASCSTSYQPTVTPICSTTLSPLAAPAIPITACNQNVTFSSEYGFEFAPASGERGYHGPLMSGQEATGIPDPLPIRSQGTQRLIRTRFRGYTNNILCGAMDRFERGCGANRACRSGNLQRCRVFNAAAAVGNASSGGHPDHHTHRAVSSTDRWSESSTISSFE